MVPALFEGDWVGLGVDVFGVEGVVEFEGAVGVVGVVGAGGAIGSLEGDVAELPSDVVFGAGTATGGVGADTMGGRRGFAAVGTYETKIGNRGSAEFGVSRPSKHSS